MQRPRFPARRAYAAPLRFPRHATPWRPRQDKHRTGIGAMMGNAWPDLLSEWTLPPPAAQAEGAVEPVRVFDTAEAAMAFLARLPPVQHAEREPRRLLATGIGA